MNSLVDKLLGTLTCLVEDEISTTTNRSQPVSVTKQVLITLRFLASGTFQQVTGDTISGLHKSTVCRIIRRVTVAISRNLTSFCKVFSDTRRAKFHKAMSIRDHQFSMCNRYY